jgi:hypothetical protein
VFAVDCVAELDCLDLGKYSLAVYLGVPEAKIFFPYCNY